MTKTASVHHDPLVMKVRKILKSTEPRKYPTETRRSNYGFECWVCPYCGELCFKKGGKYKMGNYNMHFSGTHATPFWKELQLIKCFVIDKLQRTE